MNAENVHSNKQATIMKEERQHQIVQLIEQSNGRYMLSTQELARRFGVSEMTIRRDLQLLAQEGLLRRQHGGASLIPHRQGQIRKEIGIILVSATGKYSDPFFSSILEGADYRLQELGYRISYINMRSAIRTAAQARDLLRSNPVDGIILFGYVEDEGIEYLRNNVRAIIKTVETHENNLDAVSFDGYGGIKQMVEHLVRLGYRRLGFITGRSDMREQGFIDAVQAHGLPDDDELRVLVEFGLDGWTPDLGHIGAAQLMQQSVPPDAIVCASDRIAIGAIQWLHQHDFRVPGQVAVTGFDNITESAFTVPSLTTVHVHKQLMGRLVAERAVARIENEDEIPLLIQTPTYLVIRQSCGSTDPPVAVR
jgi:DNA-binding LacI/PurR family transcriptional regulator/DNA-binding CsgD family transcriptional regulator